MPNTSERDFDLDVLTVVLWVLAVLGICAFLLLFVSKLVRRRYKFPTPAVMTRVVDNPVRRRLIQSPDVVSERMRLRPGMKVVDIGPGKGSYSIAVARRILPGGMLYAVDIQEYVVDRLRERVEREGIENIVAKIDDVYNLSFSDGSIDRVLMIAALPEVPEPVRALREIYRILKPEGLLSLSELFPDPDYPRRKTEKRWAEEAGFELLDEFGNWFVYQLIFAKKA